MTLQQFLLILWARRRVVIGTLLGTIALVLAASLVLPKRYAASTDVVIDVKSPDPVVGVLLPGLTAPGYMATQVDIINSDRVARHVVRQMGLDHSQDSLAKWAEETNGKGDLVSWLASSLQRKLQVKPSRESNVINITFTSSDAASAARFANAFAEAYIATNIELRVEPAKQYAVWFDDQMRQHRDRLEGAQRALSDYQQKTGIVVSDEKLDFETQRLTDLTLQLTLAKTQSAEAVSKQRLGGGDNLPEVLQNPLITQLKTDVARAESKLAEMSGNLGLNHPQYQRSEAELNELKSRLRAETARVAGSIGASSRVNQAKEGEIQAAIEAQKRRVLELRQQRDEISVLLREVDTAQRAFDAVGQRLTQSKLESQSLQSNISVLTPATEPVEASSPNILKNLVIGSFLGTFLAVGIALVMEFLRRVVRSRDDLSALGLPVLIELESAASGRREWRWRRGAKAVPMGSGTAMIGEGTNR